MASPTTSLLKDLIAHWNLNEASGSRADSRSTHTLADNNTVGQATGKLGDAALFVRSNSEYLSITSNSEIQTGNVNFSFSAWVYLNSKPGASMAVLSKWNTGGQEYLLVWETADQFTFYVNGGAQSVTKSGPFSTGTWYHLYCYHDADGDEIGLVVDNGTPTTLSTTSGTELGSIDFAIGRDTQSGNYWDGRIDSVSMWKRVLTDSEIARLYNRGNGLDYPFNPSLYDDLVEYWPLREASGTRTGVVGTNNLTDVNTVTYEDSIDEGTLAAQFVRANSETLSITDNADVSVGDIDFAFAIWVYLDTKPSNAHIFNKMGGTQQEYSCDYLGGGTDRFRFSTFDGANQRTVTANNFGAPSTGTWYFIYCYHDSHKDEIGISVNDGSVDTLANANGVNDSNSSFRFGSNQGTTDYWDGRITEVGFWKRILHSTEITALYNSGDGLPYPFRLTDGCIGFWKLDEVSGTRTDEAGVNDLTDVNSVTQATGKVGNAAQFTRANSEYLSISDNADLSLGSDTDFTICAWVYLDTNANFMTIAGKTSSAGLNNEEYLLRYEPSTTDRFTLRVSDGTSTAQVDADSFGSPSTGTWYYIVAWHDLVSNTINIQVNDGPVDFTAWSNGTQNTAFDFNIGNTNGASQYWDGRIDAVGIWKRVLTAAERARLFNAKDTAANGVGQEYPFGDALNLHHALKSYWKLDEASGTRANSHESSIGLGDNNTVTQATGKIGNAAQFTAANSEWLSTGLHDELGVDDDTDFTLAIWVYLDSKPGNKMVAMFQQDTANEFDAIYILRWDNGSDRFELIVGDGSSIGEIEADTLGAPSTGTWYYIVAWHDSKANTLNIQVNDGAIDSIAWTTGTVNAKDGFEIGRDGFSGTEYWDGRLDESLVTKRILTNAERTALYNGGSGAPYPLFTELVSRVKGIMVGI